ncbi:MAG: tetratricopeptide repeat protein [Bacteroidaceae bacterium]|nr:tetratricopeptide repeat protein [Bacteroidaceae bacterium]
MKTMKRMFAVMAVTIVSATAMAQYEGTTVYDRVGHGNDSIEALGNLSMLGDYYKMQNWKDAYDCVMPLLQKAPLAQVTTYTRGEYVIYQLLLGTMDKGERQKYLTDLLFLEDTRMKHVQALNSFSKPQNQTSHGAVLARKAYYYSIFAPNVLDNYSLDNAYDMFSEGIAEVNEDPTHEVEGFVLDQYFKTSYAKYKADQDGFREQFLKDYLLCKEVCEKMLEKANQTTDEAQQQKIVAQYDPTLMAVEHQFAESKAADRDQLIAIFTPKVEARKTDLAYLRSVINILQNNDCDDTDVYFKASKYAYDLEPSYNSAIGMAQWTQKQGKNAEAVQYYDKAIELCTSDKQKARIAMKVVYALANSGQTGSTEAYLRKAEQYDSSMAGRCDLFRAQNAAMKKDYNNALALATKAAQEDASITGTVSRLKTRIIDAQARQAEYNKANAEYKAQLEKQQKLENFWKGH